MSIWDSRAHQWERDIAIYPGTYEEWKADFESKRINWKQWIFRVKLDEKWRHAWQTDITPNRKGSITQARGFLKRIRPHFEKKPISIQLITDKAIELGFCQKRTFPPYVLNVAWKAGLVQKFATMDGYKTWSKKKKFLPGTSRDGGQYIGVRYILWPEEKRAKKDHTDDLIESLYHRSKYETL